MGIYEPWDHQPVRPIDHFIRRKSLRLLPDPHDLIPLQIDIRPADNIPAFLREHSQDLLQYDPHISSSWFH